MSGMPRINISEVRDAHDVVISGRGTVRSTPGVTIDVEFDYDDSENAVRLLDKVVEEVIDKVRAYQKYTGVR